MYKFDLKDWNTSTRGVGGVTFKIKLLQVWF